MLLSFGPGVLGSRADLENGHSVEYEDVISLFADGRAAA